MSLGIGGVDEGSEIKIELVELWKVKILSCASMAESDNAGL
jgi:hypothetical protein